MHGSVSASGSTRRQRATIVPTATSPHSRRTLELGINIDETSVSKYMVQRRKPPSPTWRTFLITT
jgi:hypothetical protein